MTENSEYEEILWHDQVLPKSIIGQSGKTKRVYLLKTKEEMEGKFDSEGKGKNKRRKERKKK